VFVPRKITAFTPVDKIGFSQPVSKNTKVPRLKLQSERGKVHKYVERQKNKWRKGNTSASKLIHQLVKI